jgi:hypothetical protein
MSKASSNAGWNRLENSSTAAASNVWNIGRYLVLSMLHQRHLRNLSSARFRYIGKQMVIDLDQFEQSALNRAASMIGLEQVRLGKVQKSDKQFDQPNEVRSYWLSILIGRSLGPRLICSVVMDCRVIFLGGTVDQIWEMAESEELLILGRKLHNPDLRCPPTYAPDSLGQEKYDLFRARIWNWFCLARFDIMGSNACLNSEFVECFEKSYSSHRIKPHR